MSLRRTVAALAVSAVALGGLSACGDDEKKRPSPAPATSQATQSQAASVPSAQELTDILNKASDPALPIEQKVDLVEGGQEAPELFDQIAKLKQEKNANITINTALEGNTPGTATANAVITQAGQQDINVEAQFIDQNGQWKLQKSFACALITNAGLQAPPTCAA